MKNKKRANEIGSEFSNINNGISTGMKLPKGFKDYLFTISGRAAIDSVLKNISNIKKAMLPSYCCDSMIEPFRNLNIDVVFYDVNYYDTLQINISVPNDVDLLLWCNYFGYNLTMPNLSDFIDRGGIVVEDITHSLYSLKQYDEQSHFLIASLRKWGPLISGGYCASKNSCFKNKKLKTPSDIFVKNKKEAMLLKEEYLLDNDETKKEEALELFRQCNYWLSKNYVNLSIDSISMEIIKNNTYEAVIKKRRENAKELYKGLKNHSDIEFVFDLDKMDCPIFVPVIIKNGKINYYKNNLITNKIYCPSHWPKPNEHCVSNLYGIELSLICDQRYSIEEMKRIINVLSN